MADTPNKIEIINAAEPDGAAEIYEPPGASGQTKEANNNMLPEEMADIFIKIANDLVNTQKIGNVSRAMRLATSMFNCHEYSLKSPDMEVDRGDTIEWFTNEFRSMLEYHMDVIKADKDSKSSGG